MFNDLILTTKEWELDEGALKILEDLQWSAVLSFTIFLDQPIYGEHGYEEARQYILLILSVIRDIKSGKHSDDMDCIEALEAQLEQWEDFYNNYGDYEYEEDEEIEEKPCGNSLMEQVNDICIQASLRDEAEDGE